MSRSRRTLPDKLRKLSAARDVVLDNQKATIWRESGARVGPTASTCSPQCCDNFPADVDIAEMRRAGVMLTARRAAKMPIVPPGEAAHSFGLHGFGCKNSWTGLTVTSHLLPTYARVDLAFERGEGAWLIATNGRALSRFYLGRRRQCARPCASAPRRGDRRRRPRKLCHVSNLYRIPEAERLAERLCAASFADVVFFANSGAEAMECAIKMARKYQAGQRPARALPHHHLRGRVPWPHAGDARGRRAEEISRRLRPGGRGLRPGAVRRPRGGQARHRPDDRRDPDRADHGRGRRARRGARSSCARCASSATSTASCSCSTRCRPASAAPATCSPISTPASTPDIMALAKALGGGFPLGACLATAEAAKGMTAGTHGSTFGGNPLAMAAGNAVLDVMLAPGFLDRVRRIALLLKQRLAEIKDRLSDGHRRGARRGPAHRPARGRAERRAGRRAARREAARGRGRRQRRAAAAAADRRRSGDRRSDRPARPRLRAIERAAAHKPAKQEAAG